MFDLVNLTANAYAASPAVVVYPDREPSERRNALCGDSSCEYAGSAFECSVCHRQVCWCQGGDGDDVDPEGTMCCECWCKAAEGNP